ncbi:TRAP transporter substrate-binding protein DctP [Aeromicrobium sp. YIM 150415]|uniref:TRAP transporter substrate-binding protein DctP n=1 Tax=Aeromicrobium sp. YIM 150415 TaxID=2803912 RepID=UPI001966BE68|nr:TRAP transporter substrate-binding protein DctP [Aeromicrobium sp. YIM 150415]MBM9465580.1 TRAP transporter substrate-binding protein DctP [Aeromicrobium sp. YIM 150415]
MPASRSRLKTASLGIGAAVAAGLLTACAENTGNGGGGGGEGIDFGATKEEYAEALADVDPITITAQSPSPKGSLTGAKFEGYMQAVEEWSDGKISFDIAYSNAIAPPQEIDNALNDGRLDLGSVVPAYEREEFPASAHLAEATFAGGQGAFLGLLESNAWWMDVGYATDEIFEEFEEAGATVLVPAFNSGLIALNCGGPVDSLDDFAGLQVITGTATQADTLGQLGASGVSMAYPEIYEALQRGVADCSMNSLLVSVLGGFTDLTPHAIIDSGAGFGSGPGTWAFSTAAWESYPLVVQQLLFDRIDAFIESNLESVWQTISEAVGAMQDAGGGITEYPAEVRDAIAEINEARMESLRDTDAVADGDAWIDDLNASIESWDDTLVELYGEEIAYDDFPAEWSPGETDLQPYIDAIFDEVLLDHRPS